MRLRSRRTFLLLLALMAGLLVLMVALLLRYASEGQQRAADWAQPKIGCVEEVILHDTPFPCLDLSGVTDPVTDFPKDLPPAEREVWVRKHQRALRVCRAKEIMRRETARPGSVKSHDVQLAWMRTMGIRNTQDKVDQIYSASAGEGVPPLVLLGALTQESLLVELGVSEDGGNYSCGIGQLNIVEFCRWAESAPLAVRRQMGWPIERIDSYKKEFGIMDLCTGTTLEPSLVRPFYEIARLRLNGLPLYRLQPEHFEDIAFSDVVDSFPPDTEDTQMLRYEVTRAFNRSCSEGRFGIPAKAHELRIIFEETIPSALRKVQRYQSGRGFARQCAASPPHDYYPLHVGWLLAVAVFNAGPDLVDAILWYRRLTPSNYNRPEVWESFSPTDLISALYAAGKYNSATDRLEYEDLVGRPRSITWYKACVAQRHIARVVQHVSLPGITLAKSFEAGAGCQQSVFDEHGDLVMSSVPESRKILSGRIESGRR